MSGFVSGRMAIKEFLAPPKDFVAVDNTPRGKTMRAYASRCVSQLPTPESFIADMILVGEVTEVNTDGLCLMILQLPKNIKFEAVWYNEAKQWFVTIVAYGRIESFWLDAPMSAGANAFVQHAAWGSDKQAAVEMFKRKFL